MTPFEASPAPQQQAPLRNRGPARNPMMPTVNICQDIHGPWENSMLDVSMVMAPTRKPVSPPKATPAIMVRAMTGLN